MRIATILFFCLTLPAIAETTYVSGAISGVWDSTGSPFYVTNSVCVPTNDSLRIGPGVEVIFQGNYKFCVDSNAVLKAIGSIDDSIFFSALNSFAGWGGLRFNKSAEGCSLIFCNFSGGKAFGYSPETRGGAIYLNQSRLIVENSLIKGNCAEESGGAIYSMSSSLTMKNCRITSNGVYNSFASGAAFYTWATRLVLVNCVIDRNEVEGEYCSGAGIEASVSELLILNCDFVDNAVYSPDFRGQGGAISTYGSDIRIINSLFYDNFASAGREIFIKDSPCSLFVDYTFLDRYGCYIDCVGEIVWGSGNLYGIPGFANYDDSEYRLVSWSPCQDNGIDSFFIGAPWDTLAIAPSTDIDGTYRPADLGYDIGSYEGRYEGIEELVHYPNRSSISVHPNPFNSAVTITLDGVGDGSPVPLSVEIYDVAGRRIADAELVEAGASRFAKDTSTGSVSVFTPGEQGGSFIWRPHETLPSGVYLVRATAERGFDKFSHREVGVTVATKRVVYLK